ncbi:hypothetical protein P7C71_g3582, partial [Lecanoromycetidae sp. Uapishka_2]
MHLTQPSFLLSSLLAGALSAAFPAPDTHFFPNFLAKRSIPTIDSNPLSKRANPTIGSGIDTGNPQQGGRLQGSKGSFSQAYQLMNYVTTTASEGQAVNKNIYVKYFDPRDKDSVLAVFSRLLGGTDATDGAAEMSNIKVEGGEVGPDDPAPAALGDYETNIPILILSEDAWVYPDYDPNADACKTWAEEGMTQDMLLLASILLHEYTHWDWFLASIHRGEIDDQEDGYGWEAARALDKSTALYNADSYNWYATELFWAIQICTKNGYFLVYPSPDEVVWHSGYQTLKDYRFGKKELDHKFCPNCGSSILIDFHNPEKWAVNVDTILPKPNKTLTDSTKARMIKDLDVTKLNMRYFDGLHKLSPTYEA